MNKELVELSVRLKDAQKELILSAARAKMMPSDSVIRKIAELEQAIVATETLIEEQAGR